MPKQLSEADARLALNSIAERRRQVIAEIDMPPWYWLGLAVGWVAVGVIVDLGNPWVTALATLAFGAVHAAVAPRVLSGRRRSQRMSVHRDLVSRRVPALVLGFVVAMGAATTGVSFLIHADGAEHPGTIASTIVALAVLSGGPALMKAVRRRAERDAIA